MVHASAIRSPSMRLFQLQRLSMSPASSSTTFNSDQKANWLEKGREEVVQVGRLDEQQLFGHWRSRCVAAVQKFQKHGVIHIHLDHLYLTNSSLTTLCTLFRALVAHLLGLLGETDNAALQHCDRCKKLDLALAAASAPLAPSHPSDIKVNSVDGATPLPLRAFISDGTAPMEETKPSLGDSGPAATVAMQQPAVVSSRPLTGCMSSQHAKMELETMIHSLPPQELLKLHVVYGLRSLLAQRLIDHVMRCLDGPCYDENDVPAAEDTFAQHFADDNDLLSSPNKRRFPTQEDIEQEATKAAQPFAVQFELNDHAWARPSILSSSSETATPARPASARTNQSSSASSQGHRRGGTGLNMTGVASASVRTTGAAIDDGTPSELQRRVRPNPAASDMKSALPHNR